MSLIESYCRLDFHLVSGSLELAATEFKSPQLETIYKAVRGKVAVGRGGYGTFPWTSGVKGLVAVFLLSKIHQNLDERVDWLLSAGLSSTNSTLSNSLDYALSKTPAWLAEMFGCDSFGRPVARRIFLRLNPEGKRPGPVIVALNRDFLPPTKIRLYIEGEEVCAESQFVTLLQKIEVSSPIVLNEAISSKKKPTSIGSIQSKSEFHNSSLSNYAHSIAVPQSKVTSFDLEMRRIADIVYASIMAPYIGSSQVEAWSCADSVLGLIRLNEYRPMILNKCSEIVDLLKPNETGGVGIDECSSAIPIVTATCAMALAELLATKKLMPEVSLRAYHSLRTMMRHLLDHQSGKGWWTIISGSPSTLTHEENGRSWDTGFVVLALIHISRMNLDIHPCDSSIHRAVSWLCNSYADRGRWANSIQTSLHFAPALHTFLNFVMLVVSETKEIGVDWSPNLVTEHLLKVCEEPRLIEEIDKVDYRLIGEKLIDLPHPNHINHVAFIIASFQKLAELGVPIALPTKLGETITNQLYLERSVYPYSQILQGRFLYGARKYDA